MKHRSYVRYLSYIAFSLLFLLIAGITYWATHRAAHSDDALQLSPQQRTAAQQLQEQLRADSLQRLHRAKPLAALGEPFPFDPNHADSVTLRRVGLLDWQVHNLMNYRRKGGVWHSVDDFRRLYGLSAEAFERLAPYVRIRPADAARRSFTASTNRASNCREGAPVYDKVEKYPAGTVIDLNAADTTQLKCIPGIGSYYASKIVRYRERLGGFLSVHQISEVEGLPADIAQWFKVSADVKVRRIQLSKADFKTLVRHPYLSYEQTCVIVSHVRRYGPLHSWNDLRLYKEFQPADFERLTRYFDL